ncbi:MAG: hypothetical protein AB7U83_12975 [Vicinamibacterales bacterium]
MRRALPVVLLAAAALAAAPLRVAAWGFPAHRHVADRMIELLPEALRPLYEARRAFIVDRSIDPDLWRNVGWEDEPPNHFLDLDFEAYGRYPFEALPREYDQAVQKFGRAVVHEQGLLPWRTAEFHGRLQRAFASLSRPSPSPYVLDDIALFSAVLCHYVSDGHVPLHAVKNYDGLLTGQPGAHSRFEAELFERFAGELRVVPTPQPPVTDPRGEMFRILLASQRLADPVLAADRAAAAGRDYYDDAFFAAFKSQALPILDQRVADAVAATAAFITGAWEQAGKPAVPTRLTRSPRRVPKPSPPPGR